jgi:glycerophosphoryl diester phosphodiesterase
MNPSRSPFEIDLASGPFIWAHRGASALAPENSLAAYHLAAEIGANGVELDVRLTRDGVPVIVHDPWIWSDGSDLFNRPDLPTLASMHKLRVAECVWSDLGGKPLIHRDGSRSEIPRLETVFDELPSWLWIDVEVKAGRFYDPRIVDVVLGCVARRPERVLLSSFDHLVLRESAQREPSVPLLAICHARLIDPASVLAGIPTRSICIDRPFVTASDISHWQDEGLLLSVGALYDSDDLREVLDWPLAAIFVDDPRVERSRTSSGRDAE